MVSLNNKHVQHVKIYQPCNFEENLNTHLGVIALFSSNFQNLILFGFFSKTIIRYVNWADWKYNDGEWDNYRNFSMSFKASSIFFNIILTCNKNVDIYFSAQDMFQECASPGTRQSQKIRKRGHVKVKRSGSQIIYKLLRASKTNVQG